MKKSIVSWVLAAIALPISAAQAPSTDRLLDCAAVASATDRLACFDREVAPFARLKPQSTVPPATAAATSAAPAKPAVTPSPTSPSPTVATAPTAPAPVFGGELLAPKSRAGVPQEQQVLHARIGRLRAGGTGIFLVYLDNEQVWRHEDESNGSYLREGEAITIAKTGGFGTYRLTRDAGSAKNWIRVTRVR